MQEQPCLDHACWRQEKITGCLRVPRSLPPSGEDLCPSHPLITPTADHPHALQFEVGDDYVARTALGLVLKADLEARARELAAASDDASAASSSGSAGGAKGDTGDSAASGHSAGSKGDSGGGGDAAASDGAGSGGAAPGDEGGASASAASASASAGAAPFVLARKPDIAVRMAKLMPDLIMWMPYAQGRQFAAMTALALQHLGPGGAPGQGHGRGYGHGCDSTHHVAGVAPASLSVATGAFWACGACNSACPAKHIRRLSLAACAVLQRQQGRAISRRTLTRLALGPLVLLPPAGAFSNWLTLHLHELSGAAWPGVENMRADAPAVPGDWSPNQVGLGHGLRAAWCGWRSATSWGRSRAADVGCSVH